MKLKVVGTGSKGNAYLLENDTEALLIECGVNFLEIKKAVEFNISKIKGCIVTHEHADHSKSLKELIKNGIEVYATFGTFNDLKIDITHHRVNTFDRDNNENFINKKIGNFTVKPFKINHDVADPLGFFINHPETGNVLFLTDSCYSNYTFKGMNNIIIEANYSEALIDEKLEDKAFLRDRIYTSHMSLETCLGFFEANDLSKVNNIVLIHLSDSNSNEKEFKKAVEEQTGKTVYVASNGMVIENFNKIPF